MDPVPSNGTRCKLLKGSSARGRPLQPFPKRTATRKILDWTELLPARTDTGGNLSERDEGGWRNAQRIDCRIYPLPHEGPNPSRHFYEPRA